MSRRVNARRLTNKPEALTVLKAYFNANPGQVNVPLNTDSDASLSGLPTGSTVKVRVTAANSAGESLPSAEAQIVVP